MNVKKRFRPAALGLLSLCLAVVSACSSSGTPAPAAGDETQPKEIPTINIMTAWDPGYQISSESPVFLNWGKAAGVKFNANIPPRDSFKEKVNVMLASNELPDLFRFFQDDKTFNEYGPQLFVNLNEYIEAGKLPNLERWLKKYPEIRTRMTNPDGGIYGFPIVQDFDFANRIMYVRNDLLKKEGWDAGKIKTIDDFKQAMLALKKVKGSDYITSSRLGYDYYFDQTTVWFGIARGIRYDETAKQYVFSPTDDAGRFKQWVELERWMYEQKLLDPSFLTMKDQELFAGLANDKYSLARTGTGAGSDNMLKSTAPDLEIVPLYPVPIDGKIWTQAKSEHYNIGYRSPWVINKKSKHIDAIIRAMDYTYSDAGVEMFMLGVEGETFVKDGKTPSGYRLINVQSVWTKGADGKYPDGMKTLNDYGYYAWWLTGVVPIYNRFSLLNYKEGEQAQANFHPDSIQKLEEMGALRSPDPYLPFSKAESDKIAEITTPIYTYLSENTIKFIMGQKPMSEWDSYVEGYKKFRVDELKKLHNDKLASLK